MVVWSAARPYAAAFLSGALLAFISFGVLPKAIAVSNVYLASFGALAGIMAAVFAESAGKKPGALLNNVAKGAAIAAMLAVSPREGIKLAALFLARRMPDSLGAALQTALGAAIGAALGIGPFAWAALSFAGGAALYQTTGGAIPRECRGGTAACGVAGFVFGVVLSGV